MTQKEFYKGFFITFAIAGLLSLLSLQWAPFKQYTDLVVISLIFFSGLTWGIYMAGEYLCRQENKNLFTYLSMFVILFKLVAAIVIIVGYDKLVQPPDKHYALLFALLYIIFTVFEVRILMKQSNVTVA